VNTGSLLLWIAGVACCWFIFDSTVRLQVEAVEDGELSLPSLRFAKLDELIDKATVYTQFLTEQMDDMAKRAVAPSSVPDNLAADEGGEAGRGAAKGKRRAGRANARQGGTKRVRSDNKLAAGKTEDPGAGGSDATKTEQQVGAWELGLLGECRAL